MKNVHGQIIRQAEGRCFYCARQIRAGEYTMDHLFPLSRGGSSKRRNMVLACAPCNNLKADRMPTRQEVERARSRNWKFTTCPTTRVWITQTDLGWTIYSVPDGRVIGDGCGVGWTSSVAAEKWAVENGFEILRR